MATVTVGKDGKAPKGLSAGTVVKTGGGDYKITGVRSDGSYISTKVTSGSSKSSGSKSGGSASAKPSSYTLNDFLKINPDYSSRYDPNTKTAYVSNTKTGKEVSFGLGQGQEYGLGGIQGGSHTITDAGKLISALSGDNVITADTLPQYDSPYTKDIGQTLAAIQDRPAFKYDPSKDVGLQAAQTNVMDAVSRSAARRGMLYSDSNKAQMGKSALELVPQFEQAAFNRYSGQGNDLYNQLAALQGADNTAYGQFRDTVGDARYIDQTAYNRGQDARNFGLQEAGVTGMYNGQMTPDYRASIAALTGIDPFTGKPTFDATNANRNYSLDWQKEARISSGGSGGGSGSSGKSSSKSSRSDTISAIKGTQEIVDDYRNIIQNGDSGGNKYFREQLLEDFEENKDYWAKLGYDLNAILAVINQAPTKQDLVRFLTPG